MNIDPETSKWLILGGIVVLCGLAVLFILAVAAVIIYRSYTKQKKSKNGSARHGAVPTASPREPGQKQPVGPKILRANQLDLLSFDDAIEISLETIRSTNIDQAVQYLGQELKLEDLNTIWVISEVLPELLVREDYSVDDANFLVKNYKDNLRSLPAMDRVFSEFPASGREMMEMGDQVDDLLLRYMDMREQPEGESFLAQNPILTTLFADMRITSLALRQFLDNNQTEYWDVKKEIAFIRDKISQ